MKKNWNCKKSNIIAIIGLAVILGFGFPVQEVKAVGIHVDENAVQTEEEAEKQNDEKSEAGKEDDGKQEDLKSAEEPGDTKEESIEPQPGELPLFRQIKEASESNKDIRLMMLAKKADLLRAQYTPGNLDISEGNIVLSEGGKYIQKDKLDNTIAQGELNGGEKLTITGTSSEYCIRIESGASQIIDVTSMTITLPRDTEGGNSAIYIEQGATATLVLGDPDTVLTGNKFKPAITVEEGGYLNLEGKGILDAAGGAGADAVSGPNNARGGSFRVKGEARLKAYSDQEAGACNVKVSSVSNKILQGTLQSPAAMTIKVQAENRDNRTEKYEMDLPEGCRSFAVSTTAEGGDYVSYFPNPSGEVQDSHLLVNAELSSKHSYNLTGAANTFAQLDNLVDQQVKYTVIFNANGGKFTESNSERLIYDESKKVGYGEIIAAPPGDKAVKRDQHTVLGWYRLKDSTADADKWVFDRDKIVRENTTIYVAWKPDSCTVLFYSEGQRYGEPKSYNYEATVPVADVWAPGDNHKPGYSIAYWTDETGQRWVFGDDGTKLTRLQTRLTAQWRQNCTVTFEPNAGADDSKVTGMEKPQSIPETQLVKRPGNPQRLGYQFMGWYKDQKCTQMWDFDVDTASGSSMKLYAGWGADTTIVTFHVDTEKEESVTPDTRSVDFGYVIKEPEAYRPPRKEMATDYVVEGWYTDDKLTQRWDFTTELKDADGKFDLYVKWRQETCYAILNPGANDAEPQKVKEMPVKYENSLETDYGSGAEQLSGIYTRKGYKIAGWSTMAGGEWALDKAFTEDVSLKPKWELEVYEVEFVTPSDADAPQLADNKQSVVYNRTVTKPAYPETEDAWPGHTFKGWYTEENGGGEKWNFTGEPGANKVEGPVTLYAFWEWDEYTISFQTYEGDENPIPDQILHYGELVMQPEKPSREHCEFQGWFTDAEHTQSWDFDIDTVTGDMTFYAGWEGHVLAAAFHVRYEPEHASQPDEEVEFKLDTEIRYGDFLDREVLESQEHTSPRKGYTLNGWFTDSVYTPESEWDFAQMRAEPEDETLDLYAYWTWDEYTVDFFTYEGDEENQIPSIEGVRYGEKIARPEADPVREHYEFGGWYPDLNAEEKTEWNFKNDTVTGDMTLYAEWVPNIYLLSFETNGGSSLSPVKVTYGTHVEPAKLKTTRQGYILSGWYRDPGFTEEFIPAQDYVDSDMTIYAKWELQKFTVRFHYRTDRDSPEEEVITYTDVYQTGSYITKPNKTIPHKTLSSWYRDSSWQKENQWVFKRDKVSGDTDLYAYWSDTLYHVHYETYGGTEITDTQLPWGSLLDAPEAPEHEGGTFGGWYKDAQLKETWNFEEDFVDGDTTLYAKWNMSSYTVTFDAAGGTGGPGPQTLPYGSLIPEPEPPVREGYTFAGWKNGGEEGTWNFQQDTILGDMTLTAQWTEGTSDPGIPDPRTPDPGTPGNQNNTGDTGKGSGSPEGTLAKAAEALTDAANGIKKVLTGDKAPLTYAITGIFLSAAAIIWALKKKFKH